MNNLKEFKELIVKYNSITIEDIGTEMSNFTEVEIPNSEDIFSALTGFGYVGSCSLCLALKGGKRYHSDNCKKCIWVIKTQYKCYKGPNRDSYFDMVDITDLELMLMAVKSRAMYMQDVLDNYLKSKKKDEKRRC